MNDIIGGPFTPGLDAVGDLLSVAGEGLLQLDDQGRILTINRAYAQMVGRTQSELVGQVWGDFETRIDGSETSYRAWHRHSERGAIEVEVHIMPLLEGTLCLVRGTQATTPQMRELEASSRRMSFFLNHLGDGCGLVDTEERFTYANAVAEDIFGVVPGGLVGLSLGEFLEPEQLALMEAKTKERRQGIRDSYEIAITRRDGEQRMLWITATQDTTETGEHQGTIGVFRDISERQRTEAEREALIKELQQALDQVKTMQGLLPICSHCKKIRDDQGYWSQVETYISSHSEAEFTHGICPDCMSTHFPEVLKEL